MTVGGKLIQPYILNPSVIGNMIAWYDSKDVSTITKDANDYVSAWNDKSGNDYHLVQATASNQPLYSSTDGVVFDGINDFMNVLFGATYSVPITIFVVADNKSGSTSARNILDNGNTGNVFLIGRGVDSGKLRIHSGTEISYSKSGIFDFTIFTGLYGASGAIYENNALKVSGNTGSNNLVGLTLSRIRNMADYYWDGGIKEVIIYNKACSTDEITLINDYLNAKYSIY